jgi:hypothetical protein
LFPIYLEKGVNMLSSQSLKREVLIWKELEHGNILPFLGIAEMDGIPCTVSEWMENGTMDKYLETHADVDVLELVRTYANHISA